MPPFLRRFALGDIADFAATIWRYPGPVLLSTAFTWLALFKHHDADALPDTWEIDVFATLVIGFFWALSAHLAARARAWPTTLEWLLVLAGPLLTFAILWATPDEPPIAAALLGEAAVLTTLAAATPGLRAQDNESLWRFTAMALEGAAIALVAAVILAVGVSILVFSITYLFELRDSGRLIPDIWIISLSLFWPLRALSTLPRPTEAPESLTLQFNAALPFLLNWALVPIWCAYLAVLYAYAAKILIEWSLPRGGVAWMVHGFGALGVAVWLMAWPQREGGAALTRLFHRWFWWTLPVPLLLLAIGVLERVSEYGWTEPRYMVAAGGVWLAAMALVYGTLPRRVPLALAPLSLAILCLFGAFGPWDATSVSVRDQQARLADLLSRHQILVNGRVVPAANPSSIPSSDVKRIGSSFEFLVARRRTDLLTPWFVAEVPGTRAALVAAIGLREVDPVAVVPRQRSITTAFGQLPWMQERPPLLLDIAGYDSLGLVTFNGADNERTIDAAGGGAPYRLSLDRAAMKIQLQAPSGRTATVELAAAFTQLFDVAERVQLTAEQSRPAVLAATGELRARLIIQRVTLHKLSSGDFSIPELSFMIALADR